VDAGRSVSPLARADDAVELDSTDLTLTETVDAVVRLLDERLVPEVP
jgi:cytidylate kinase